MAGAVAYAQRDLADRNLVSVSQPPVGHAGFALPAMATAILGQPLQQEGIVHVRSFDRDAELACGGCGRPGMVKVPMREQHFFQIEAMGAERRLQSWQLPARVYQSRP